MTRAAPRRADPAAPPAAPAPRKILLLRFRRIGDVVMTTPAVVLLKRRFPESHLTYLVEEPYRRLVEGHPQIDRVLVVPARQTRPEFVRLLGEVRRERFDVLLDMHGGPRASWITLASRAGLKIGHGIERKGFLYHKTAPRKGNDAPLHSVETHAGLVRALGVPFRKPDIPPLSLPPARPEETALAESIKNAGGGSRLVVLHIGAGNAYRDWGTDRIAALAKALAAVPGVRIALIGGRGDRTREAEILGRMPGRGESGAVVPLAGRLNLIEFRELAARASLFVGPDSGPMHVAASTGTPIVAYFGPTSPAHFGPWRPGPNPAPAVILQRELACRPCRQRECPTADFRCLRDIAPEEVLAACRPFLGS